jgi:hypothetical protein
LFTLIFVSEGFVQQLKEYEPIYQAKKALMVNGQCSLREERSVWKRKRDSLEQEAMTE